MYDSKDPLKAEAAREEAARAEAARAEAARAEAAQEEAAREKAAQEDAVREEAANNSSRLARKKDALLHPFTLPCGLELRNRLVKAAMTERLSFSDYAPNRYHHQLYEHWANSGVSLLITGNMLVDHRSLESAGNIAPLMGDQREALRTMAENAKSGGAQVWVQLNHAGRQSSRFNNLRPVSASNVGLNKLGFFARPRPLKAREIEELIARYVQCSELLLDCGFDGIQIHAAHGYLLSQFLSPLTNLRTDEWGGSLENRARFLLQIVRAVRKALGTAVPVSVKINSADFQRGGFEQDDSLQVIAWLEAEGIDLLEISGGNYERLVFFQDRPGNQEKDSTLENMRASTREREAYFGDFARKVKASCSVPVLLTGGFRSREGCLRALEGGDTDLIGMARPFLCQADFGLKFLQGHLNDINVPSVKLGLRHLDDLAEAGFWDAQLDRLSRGLEPDLNLSASASFAHILKREAGKAMAKRWANLLK